MSVLNPKRRAGAPYPLADHAESCEVRVLLSAAAIYPAQAVVQEAESVAPAADVSPLAQASDYHGTWTIGGGTEFTFDVLGNKPNKAKFNGSFTAPSVAEPLKFKGKIKNSDELIGKYKGKGYFMGEVKVKVVLSAKLTSSTTFDGSIEVFAKGFPPTPAFIIGTKL